MQGNQYIEEDLTVNGGLSVKGTGTSSFAGSLTVNGGVGIGTKDPGNYKLNVHGNQYLSGDLTVNGGLSVKGTGTTSFAGGFTVKGAITPSKGNRDTHRIRFVSELEGGSGDAAWIRYYKREEGGEGNTLEIGTSDNTDAHIALMPLKGGVGIGTNNPNGYKLNVQGKQYLRGSLVIDGQILLKLPTPYKMIIKGTGLETEQDQVPRIWLNGERDADGERHKELSEFSRGIFSMILAPEPDGNVRGNDRIPYQERGWSKFDVYGQHQLWNEWAGWLDENARYGDLIAVVSKDSIGPVPKEGRADELLRKIKAGKIIEGSKSGYFKAMWRWPYALLFSWGAQRCLEELTEETESYAELICSYPEILPSEANRQLMMMGEEYHYVMSGVRVLSSMGGGARKGRT